ncbi:MAG: HD domain-containing protein [Lachnospiraceae bacterium]|nr:HD domain-containing protein [Lachnospiraceae bacterium]
MSEPVKTDKYSRYRVAVTIIGVAVNALLSFLAHLLQIPLYLDTVGTIFTTAVAGLFPGMVVAAATNILCTFFQSESIYFVLINVLIAICTAWFMQEKRWQKNRSKVLFLLALSLIGGEIGILFQWVLLEGPQLADVAEAARELAAQSGIPYPLCTGIINFGLNIVDKSLSAGIAIHAMRLIPRDTRQKIRDTRWKQRPLTEEETNAYRRQSDKRRESLSVRMTILISVSAVLLAAVIVWISMSLYFENVKKEYERNAQSAATFAASVVDAGRIGDYLREGENAPGYPETRALLEQIRDNAPGVQYLYVEVIDKDGCYFVFDLDAEDGEPGYLPGERVDIDEEFQSLMPALLAGEEIEPISSAYATGWVLTFFAPIRSASGQTVAYAGADVALKYLTDFNRSFLLKIIFVFSGFFVLILGYGLHVARSYLVYPVNSMVARARGFVRDGTDQKDLDENARKIEELDIRTGDEVELLYQALSKLATATAEQMRDIRHYADATAKMQNGLIITMADMVENRDSDTGAHVQKTAAYVRIILNGLMRKGYYPDKISPKYISDVEMSAPLHDVGKINIPDTILSKPGKLSPEEFEIMKTHTTSGKLIMERAINTLGGETYLKEARNMAAYHHERWDGKGYPEHLRGEVIPLSARVMAVADVFDALASRRVYKPALPFEKALEILEENAGTQFDPKCVEVFVESQDEIRQVMRKYQDA